nr:MAG TPA: hypothetical protein [Caudoviricetes sp.]
MVVVIVLSSLSLAGWPVLPADVSIVLLRALRVNTHGR